VYYKLVRLTLLYFIILKVNINLSLQVKLLLSCHCEGRGPEAISNQYFESLNHIRLFNIFNY